MFPLVTFLAISIPIGLTSSLDISLSNVSLSLITLSTYVMIKSTVPLFVTVFAICMGIEKLTTGLVAVVALISLGEVVTVSGGKEDLPVLHNATEPGSLDNGGNDEAQAFGSPLGVALCLAASIVSGLRWTLVQFLLQSLPSHYRTPMCTIRITAPTMWVLTLVSSMIIEAPWTIINTEYAEDGGKALETFMVALAGGVIAVMMIMCEFGLILKSTAVVMMIGGVLKELLTIVLGVMVFGDTLTGRNLAGFAIVLCEAER